MSLLADEQPQSFTGRASASERTIRLAVCERLREILPEARIVHEIPVWGRRADLAAIEPERITLFEIKSERDNLSRCDDQMRAFNGSSHHAVLVAHERWFDRTPYTNGSPRLVWPGDYHSHSVWCFPEPPEKHLPFYHYHWRLPAAGITQPAPRRLLELLWRAELYEECKQVAGIVVGARSTCPYMIDQMAYNMTGRDIARAVCRQLRKRSFPTADAPR